MNVLIIGSGGREHALAWKAAQSELANTVYVAPGNAGTALEPNIENIDLSVSDFPALIDFAKNNDVGLTIIGPEVPLVEGIVDAFTENGLKCFGPSKGAAQLEGSKTFTKDFLERHNIPSAAYGTFTEEDKAIAYLQSQNTYPIVIKADGLAAGKGVVIAENEAHASTTVKDMLSGNSFGDAGCRVVIEAFLVGEEASFIVMSDGKNILPLATSQDHKARDNGDKGPNTGGMGAYSPAPLVTDALHQQVMDEVIKPTVNGMAAEGNTYVGFLYAGLMMTADGPKVLEYNCRFGDPETQPIMMRLQSDLVALCLATLEQKLETTTAQWHAQTALGVVLAAGGYPDAYEKGKVIHGLDKFGENDLKVFHAGTIQSGNDTLTQGGRVLCVCALGDTVKAAQTRAYEGVNLIQWENVYFRTDIGFKAL
ncbi:MAG: phosphoribosylamine--glycine ligase [Methylococcales bacterium]|jgi:phosphoribosylamine---glycine ligase|nr:phosphoribosylamine--glycine ligase [Methylococcales bacterium]